MTTTAPSASCFPNAWNCFLDDRNLVINYTLALLLYSVQLANFQDLTLQYECIYHL